MIQEKIQSFPEEDFPLYGEEIIKSEEGTLIDHLITIDGNGNYHAYKECPLNCWMSCWLRLTGTENEILDYWYQFIAKGEQDEY